MEKVKKTICCNKVASQDFSSTGFNFPYVSVIIYRSVTCLLAGSSFDSSKVQRLQTTMYNIYKTCNILMCISSINTWASVDSPLAQLVKELDLCL